MAAVPVSSAARRTAALVLVSGTRGTSGKRVASQRRHWARASGLEQMRWMSAGAPLASRACCTSTRASA